MSDVVVDTSVIVDYKRGFSADFEKLELARLEGAIRLFIPHTVIAELFAGEEANKKQIRTDLDEMVSGIEPVGLSQYSARILGELMRVYSQIPDVADLMIAAVALEQKAQVATHNEKHFAQIRGIELFDFSKI